MAVNLLAPTSHVIFKSSNPEGIYCGSPAICSLPNGRLIASHDIFGAQTQMLNAPESCYDNVMNCFASTFIYVSDDGGESWRQTGCSPCCHATPFYAGGRLYIMGNGDGRLIIKASDDNGDSWGKAACIFDGTPWNDSSQLPEGMEWVPPAAQGRAMWRGGVTNPIVENGFVYFPGELRKPIMHNVGQPRIWPVAGNAPMLARGKADTDLTDASNWVITPPRYFCDEVGQDDIAYAGLPFYSEKRFECTKTMGGKNVSPMGPLEFNVVRIKDPNHIWYDPSGKTLYLFGRFGCARTGLAVVYRVIEEDDGTLRTDFVYTPGNAKWLILPFPGGQMKFHIQPDEKTHTYWLISSQATDGMRRPDRLPSTRFNLPYDQRNRLQLHFSYNLVDWCFAGMIDIGPGDKQSRHYCGACIRGEDLLVVSRSGSEKAASAHNVDMMTLHIVKNFRDLIY